MCVTPGIALTLLKNVTASVTAIDSVARIANARAEAPADWISIVVAKELQDGASSVMPLPYDRVARRCEGLLTGLQWTFVIARAGADYNPHDVVIGARLDPVLGNAVFRNATSWHSGTTKVWFQLSVKFVWYVEQVTTTDEVAMPSLVPEVDKDLFYPFRLPEYKDESDRE